MAKEYKKGLDYFPYDTYFDDKIELVEAKFGLEGTGYLSRLWQKIYRQNWFIEWNEDVELLFCRDHLISYGKSQEIFKFLLEKNVFSHEIYSKYNILTSKGLQKRYFAICLQLKRKHEDFIEDYILLEDSFFTNKMDMVVALLLGVRCDKSEYYTLCFLWREGKYMLRDSSKIFCSIWHSWCYWMFLPMSRTEDRAEISSE